MSSEQQNTPLETDTVAQDDNVTTDKKLPSATQAAQEALEQSRRKGSRRQLLMWLGALLLGAGLGWLGIGLLNQLFEFIAAIYTRLFQFIAIPTIALAVITTLASLGAQKNTGRIFGHAVSYTFLTTILSATVALIYFICFAPGSFTGAESAEGVPENLEQVTYYEHFLSVIPDNVLKPLLSGNVLSVMLIAAATGLALAFMPKTENRDTLLKGLLGLQELLFTLIKGLIWSLPLGIMAYAAQLSAQISQGLISDSLVRYTLVILTSNLTQFFLVLPLVMLIRGLNPLRVFKAMSPALLVALFTKSSAGTLPVTMASAEGNLRVNSTVSRFVLPLCTTINMNGCAAFILVTSLFIMQSSGTVLTPATMIAWLFIAVLAAVGNAGVPMGCYFLTLSLTTGQAHSALIMGAILPIYTIIDMVETAENVWSDSCVCAMTDHDLKGMLDAPV